MAGKPLPFSLEQLRSIVEQYPTPFHLYDAGGIRRCIRGLQAAFGWNPGFREYFAVKAPPPPATRRTGFPTSTYRTPLAPRDSLTWAAYSFKLGAFPVSKVPTLPIPMECPWASMPEGSKTQRSESPSRWASTSLTPPAATSRLVCAQIAATPPSISARSVLPVGSPSVTDLAG